jgi:hypothetical protein
VSKPVDSRRGEYIHEEESESDREPARVLGPALSGKAPGIASYAERPAFGSQTTLRAVVYAFRESFYSKFRLVNGYRALWPQKMIDSLRQVIYCLSLSVGSFPWRRFFYLSLWPSLRRRSPARWMASCICGKRSDDVSSI